MSQTETPKAEERTEETRSFVRRVRTATRRKYTPEEKIHIVLEGFRREVTVSELCGREGIKPHSYCPVFVVRLISLRLPKRTGKRILACRGVTNRRRSPFHIPMNYGYTTLVCMDQGVHGGGEGAVDPGRGAGRYAAGGTGAQERERRTQAVGGGLHAEVVATH